MILENEIIHLMFKLNLQNRTGKAFQFWSNRFTKNLIFTFLCFYWENCWLFLKAFVNSFKNFCWFILLGGIFFLFFLLAWATTWRHIGPALISVWAFFRTGYAWTNLSFDRSLWRIWLCVWHSTCIVIRNRRHFIFFIFPIAAAPYVVIVIL